MKTYGVMPSFLPTVARKVHFIVSRENAVNGTGETFTLYLTGDAWSANESNAMRFPMRALAEMYASRFKGVVEERAS